MLSDLGLSPLTVLSIPTLITVMPYQLRHTLPDSTKLGQWLGFVAAAIDSWQNKQ